LTNEVQKLDSERTALKEFKEGAIGKKFLELYTSRVPFNEVEMSHAKGSTIHRANKVTAIPIPIFENVDRIFHDIMPVGNRTAFI
jgi:hypothetical protein